MKDNTQLIQTRQLAARHKITLAICAVLAIVAFVGWLTSI